MEGIFLAENLLKEIKGRRERFIEMMASGAVKDMEEYNRLVGSLESMDYIASEIRLVLDKSME